jgi:hypothetical protein
VQDLSWLECPSLASATAVMAHALSWRHTRAHRLNNYSSRSHCMMTFKFRSQDAKMQGAKGAARRIGALPRRGLLLLLGRGCRTAGSSE